MIYKRHAITVPKVRPADGVSGIFMAVAVVNGPFVPFGQFSEVFPADGPTAEAASEKAIYEAQEWIGDREAGFRPARQ
jgi:hypothetical protein